MLYSPTLAIHLYSYLVAPPRECKLFFLFCAAPIYLFIPLSAVLAGWNSYILYFHAICSSRCFQIIIPQFIKIVSLTVYNYTSFMKVLNLLSAASAKLEHWNRWKAWEKKRIEQKLTYYIKLLYSTDNKMFLRSTFMYIVQVGFIFLEA